MTLQVCLTTFQLIKIKNRFRILPESPRWLLTMGKIDQVMEVLKEAARINKRPLPPNMDKVLKQVIDT